MGRRLQQTLRHSLRRFQNPGTRTEVERSVVSGSHSEKRRALAWKRRMQIDHRKLLARFMVIGSVTWISACGGGGGGGGGNSPPPGTISYSASSISFKAAGPYAVAPANQTITGTVTGVTTGTLYLKVVANNAITGNANGLFTVANLTVAGFSGQADVIPALPSSIGAGRFKGSITVTACLND